MKLLWATTVALLVSLFAGALSAGQGWDKKTIEKMLSDGAKKMNSPDPKVREEGMGYILGYITCPYKKQYLPVLIKGLKDSNPTIRGDASHALSRIEGKEAMVEMVALLEDPVHDVVTRGAFDLGAIGDPAAIPLMQKALDNAKKQGNRKAVSTIQEGIDEITGKSKTDHPKCP